jgi:hypothetical protein
MGYSPTQEDREWRCMAIAMYLYIYLEQISQQLRDSNQQVTLITLADHLEADFATECPREFACWQFAIRKSPEVLRNLADGLAGKGFDKMLADGEHLVVVLMVVTDINRIEGVED